MIAAIAAVALLTNTSFQFPGPTEFRIYNGEKQPKLILAFTEDGKIVPGPGLSTDEATKEAVKILQKVWADERHQTKCKEQP